jgi:hypothetical protein
MIRATLEQWNVGIDKPMDTIEKEFPSEAHMNKWLLEQDKHPFLFYNVIATVDVE